jgi:hypothetical protein
MKGRLREPGGASVRTISCSEGGGGRMRVDPAEGGKLHVIDDGGGSKQKAEGCWKGIEEGERSTGAGDGLL